ncbi:addiction module protein [Desulfobacter sp.]|uniref:addiction module protein n=1 Tax=Desulfobacter sp. TaxID=2294 RepID=UPI003D1104A2
MQNAIEIKHLTRKEKLKMVDALWTDLLSEEELLESPAWHKKALQETEQRFEEGKERIILSGAPLTVTARPAQVHTSTGRHHPAPRIKRVPSPE